MSETFVEEMLKRVSSVDDPDREPTVKLDKETMQIVNKWKLENLKATVSWLCKVANEALEHERQKSDSQTQQ